MGSIIGYLPISFACGQKGAYFVKLSNAIKRKEGDMADSVYKIITLVGGQHRIVGEGGDGSRGEGLSDTAGTAYCRGRRVGHAY
jgi:hypothetical protein